MRVFIYLLFMSFMVFGQARWYLQTPIVGSNNRAINKATVKLYRAGTTTFQATLTYHDNSAGLYYWTGGTSTVPWGDYDIYVNYTPTTLADTVRAWMTYASIRNGYTISDVSRDTIAAVLSDSAYVIAPIAGSGIKASATQFGYLDSVGIRTYLEQSKQLTAAHFGFNTDSGAALPGFTLADRQRAARWNARALRRYIDYCWGASPNGERQEVIIPSGQYWVAPEETDSTYRVVINIRTAMNIKGAGSSGVGMGTEFNLVDSVGTAGDTIVVLADWAYEEVVANKDNSGLFDGSWWHQSSIMDIAINCNGDKQEGYVAGLGIYRPGETSEASRIHIGGSVGFAVHYKKPAPGWRMNGISIFPAIRADSVYSNRERIGVWHERGSGVFIQVGGDGCSPLNLIEGTSFGHYEFMGTKSENTPSATFHNQIVHWVKDVDNATNIDFGSARYDKPSDGNKGTVILIQGTSIANKPFSVQWGGSKCAGFPVLLAASFDNGSTWDSTFTSTATVSGVPGRQSGGAFAAGYYGLGIYKVVDSDFMLDGGKLQMQGIGIDTVDVFSLNKANKYFTIRSPGEFFDFRNRDNDQIADWDTLALNFRIRSRFHDGIRIGGTSATIDTLKRSSVGDSIQIYIRGIGWKAFHVKNSQGN